MQTIYEIFAFVGAVHEICVKLVDVRCVLVAFHSSFFDGNVMKKRLVALC